MWGKKNRQSEVSIEEVRDFWNRRPCNIRHSPKPVGTKEYFDEVEARKYFVEPHIPEFAQFQRWRGKKVLEIGCGIGTDSINFIPHPERVFDEIKNLVIKKIYQYEWVWYFRIMPKSLFRWLERHFGCTHWLWQSLR